MKAAAHGFRNMNKRKLLIFRGLSGPWSPFVGLRGDYTTKLLHETMLETALHKVFW